MKKIKAKKDVHCIMCDKGDKGNTILMEYSISVINLFETYACKSCGGKIEVAYTGYEPSHEKIRSYSYRKGAWIV